MRQSRSKTRQRKLALYCGAVLCALQAAPNSALADRMLLAHRAIYDLSLVSVSDTATVEGLSGRWVFEFGAASCKGYPAESRLVMNFRTGDGAQFIDRRVHTLEDVGRSFSFQTQSYVDRELEEEVKGRAVETADGLNVTYEKPDAVELQLPHSLFPTGQVIEILDKAEAGERFFETAVFDGTEFAEDVTRTSVVIGKQRPVTEDDPERIALGTLAQDMFFDVTMAYFEPGQPEDGEKVSDYEVSFLMHKGGIQRDIVIRYPEYAMKATLRELQLLDGAPEPEKPCAATE